MLQTFFKTTLRTLWKNKTYSAMNIFGLAIGIACAGLIFLWVEDEVNYDMVNTKKDRVYLVRENQQYEAGIFTHSSTPGLLAPAIQADIPGIINTCRKSEGNTSYLFSIGDKTMYAEGCFAEPSLFSIFTIPFVQGSATTAFTQLYSIVITEKTAKKFFGNTPDVLGKTVRMDNQQDYVVTGVVKDFPANTSMQFEWVVPFEIYFQRSPWLHRWGNNSLSTYVELGEHASVASVNKQLSGYLKKKDPESITQLFLFGLKNWHLYDQFENGKPTGGGRVTYIRLFSAIAWIILLIACINFMNLATARSEKRAREVGVRKVMGAGKGWLVLQFIGEALFMTLLASFVAVLLISLLLPAFNTLVQKQLIAGFDNPLHVGSLVLITVICGLVAGSYPALYLSSFNPVFVLKGLKTKNSSVAFIRKGLVIVQFSISIILIISTVIVYQQIQHVKTRDLGFDKAHLLELQIQGEMGKNFSVFKQDLLATGAVENVAISDHTTIDGGNNTSGFTWEGKPANNKVLVSTRGVSPEFLPTSGMQLVEGRNLALSDTARGHLNVMVTESLTKLMGKGSAIGKSLHYEGDTTQAVIVGVVKDYVYGNMYGKSDPVLFTALPLRYASVMYIRMKAQTDPANALAQIAAVMKKDNSVYPFQYRFVDDRFNQKFLAEMLVSKLSRIFAALAILISCLGLFGLAAYTAERRTKEIGIRKVLGASVGSITGLLSTDFIKPVLISALIAYPLAWWGMNQWLQAYPYRITISWWVFLFAGAGAMFIALVTISFQSIKAALANPVKSLRTE